MASSALTSLGTSRYYTSPCAKNSGSEVCITVRLLLLCNCWIHLLRKQWLLPKSWLTTLYLWYGHAPRWVTTNLLQLNPSIIKQSTKDSLLILFNWSYSIHFCMHAHKTHKQTSSPPETVGQKRIDKIFTLRRRENPTTFTGEISYIYIWSLECSEYHSLQKPWQPENVSKNFFFLLKQLFIQPRFCFGL